MAAFDMSDEFPKMKCVTVTDNGGVKRKVPLVYPPKHVRHGQHVIFQSAEEERQYDNSGVPARRHEQTPDKAHQYSYDAWAPWDRI